MNQLFLANALTTVWNFFWEGGIFMILLLVSSILSMTLIIWRAMALRRELVIPKVVEEAVTNFTPTEAHLTRLLDVVNKNDSPFSRIVLQACRQFSWTKGENLTALQTIARKEVHQLEGGLTMLEIMTGLGPLLGLLGTVSGLVQVFASLGVSDGSNTAGVAGGIAEALNTTIMGLAVAIPTLIAFSIFSKRVEWLAVDMEAHVESLLAKCYHESHAGEHTPAEDFAHHHEELTPTPAPEAEADPEAAAAKTEEKGAAKDKSSAGKKEPAPAGAAG